MNNKKIHNMKYVILVLQCYDYCKIYKISQLQYIFNAFHLVLNHVHSYLKMVVLTEKCSMQFFSL
jgi:hypothetical protein